MLGSLNVYRRVLNDHVFNPRRDYPSDSLRPKLPLVGHGVAGIFAGWTVSFIAGPVEHIKARLQVQYQAEKAQRLYSGPIDCVKKIVRQYTAMSMSFVILMITVSSSRYKGCISWSVRHPSLPHFFLFLVGLLRYLFSSPCEQHFALYTYDQFLGRWTLSTNLLDDVVSIRRCQTAYHD